MKCFQPAPRQVLGARRSCLTVRAEKNWAKEAGGTVVTESMLPTSRYIATNRFKVKDGAQARFEQRWATRSSRLAELDGFRTFFLMRRVEGRPGEEISKEEPNYVSFTIWDKQENFQEWYTGDAFKEAHGGGSIFGFVDMLVNATFTLNGAPKPAFWHGLTPITTPGDMEGKRVENGWRVVNADGKNKLDPEVFVATNRFSINEGHEVDFEQRWAQRESHLKEMPGFKAFFLCRRDGLKADDGYNYQSTTIWQDKESFQNWAQSQQFAKSHGSQPGKPDSERKKSFGEMIKGPPAPAMYEGVLVLETPQGA